MTWFLFSNKFEEFFAPSENSLFSQCIRRNFGFLPTRRKKFRLFIRFFPIVLPEALSSVRICLVFSRQLQFDLSFGVEKFQLDPYIESKGSFHQVSRWLRINLPFIADMIGSDLVSLPIGVCFMSQPKTFSLEVPSNVVQWRRL